MRKLLLALLSSTIIMSGCSLLGGNEVVTPIPVVTPTPEVDATPTPVPKPKIYEVGEKAKLLCGEEEVGYVKVNRITMLRFADFTNKEAMNNSVKRSFSINATIHVSGFEQSTGLTFEPILLDKEKNVMSNIANVGWTGFSTEADFYDGTGTKTLEIGMQPIHNFESGRSFKLQISDAEGHDFKSVRLKIGSLKKAKKGPKLRKAGKDVKIKSVNGAIYCVTPKKVYFENNYIDVHDHNKGKCNLFIIDYFVKAFKPPKNHRTVRNISGFGKKALLNGACVLGLQYSESKKVFYSSLPSAGRLEYSNRSEYYEYVWDGKKIHFGKFGNCVTNRVPSDGMLTSPDFVRIRVEFPEEFEARKTLKEKLDFEGRFMIYDLAVTERKLAVYE